jgi:Rrf2 family protein
VKLSTKGRYGARAGLELALRYNSGPVMVREIAASQEISMRYLEHILNSLRSSGIVKSTRGAKGGYELSKAPGDVSLGDIVRSLEGPLDIVSCTNDKDCEKTHNCVMYSVWKEVKESMESLLDGITLEDLVNKYNALNGGTPLEFNI